MTGDYYTTTTPGIKSIEGSSIAATNSEMELIYEPSPPTHYFGVNIEELGQLNAVMDNLNITMKDIISVLEEM